MLALKGVPGRKGQRKAALGLKVLVVVAGIRRQDHPTALRVDPNTLQASRVPADVMQGNPGCKLVGAIVKAHALAVHEPHHPDIVDVLSLKRNSGDEHLRARDLLDRKSVV